jgi:Coenzyme PQQ synthesis protein D (PqqD)
VQVITDDEVGRGVSDDDFFGPPPEPPPQPPRRAQPEWVGPPSGTLPGVVALELVLARSKLAAVCVTRISAYPTGFAFDLLTVSDADAGEDLDPHLMGFRHRGGPAGRADTQLRLGVQFSDDAKATNVGAAPGFAGHDEKPQAPVLHPQGGGGGPGSWRLGYWVWPLPPAGLLAFVCEWPAASIPLTRREIDAQLVLDASARAQEIFAPGTPSRPGATITTFGAVGAAPARAEQERDLLRQRRLAAEVHAGVPAVAATEDLSLGRPLQASGLEVQELASGLLVHQVGQDGLHYLNNTAAVVFQLCDGNHTVAEIGAQLALAFGLTEVAADVAEHCISELRAKGVLS